MNEDSLLPVYRFSELVENQRYIFQVIQLEKSFILWIGSSPEFLDLNLAVNNKYQQATLNTTLLGCDSNYSSSSLAQKLAKKTAKQVFVSYNVSSDKAEIHATIAKKVFEELKLHPDKF